MNTVNTEKNEDRRLRVSPRPWKYRPDAEDIVDQHGRIIADFLGICNGPEQAANGHLMAAAPQLYEFVEMFTTISGQILLSSADNGAELYQKALDLIALANGEGESC